MQERGLVQVAAKRLLARLMPKHRASGIGADGTAKERPSQQSAFRNAPGPCLGAQLVEAGQHECDQVDQRKRREDVGQGEDVREESG